MYYNPWIYESQPFSLSPSDKWYGFVYLIINLKTNQKYIGRKYFWSNRKQKNGRRKKEESDWKEYYGSSDILKKDIEKYGVENFKRFILSLHQTKGGVNYTEIEEQILRGVLHDDTYYNKTIAGKYINPKLENDSYSMKCHSESWCEIHSKFMTKYNLDRMWITNGHTNKKHNKNEEIPFGWYKGKTLTENQKKNHAEMMKKKWSEGTFADRPTRNWTEEQRLDMSLNQTGKKNNRYGKKNSKEHTLAIVESIKETKWIHHPDGRKKRVTNYDDYLKDGWSLGQGPIKRSRKY